MEFKEEKKAFLSGAQRFKQPLNHPQNVNISSFKTGHLKSHLNDVGSQQQWRQGVRGGGVYLASIRKTHG